MNAFAPAHSYVLGTALVGLGLHAFFRPTQEYARFGLPLESTSTNTDPPRTKKTTAGRGRRPNYNNDNRLTGKDGSASPLIWLKGVREISYGLALVALQYQGISTGVTTVAGVLALAAVGDGFVVWFHGGEKPGRKKAWGHWAAAVGLGSWAAWRTFVAYGEWAAFHALNF
ncbi:hypothetical protein VP1G_00288 [Cytospora mali]|uniref:Uncharacterized protein n=1 Tax=Cytospora mali TaxID=578113 RepID=A0A194UMA1_CYTMA|nr:hypothetical protein VP1G_00288 [Valsa mali var. pyri (nom. inval.)]